MNPARDRRAVALLSGGLDSAVALLLWREGGGEVEMVVTADYGQRAAAAEARAAERLASRWGLRWQPVSLPWLGAAARSAGSALIEGAAPLPRPGREALGDGMSAAAVWVPARNVVLLSVGAAWAEALGVGVVLAGFNREEAATFADNTVEFTQAMTAALALGTRAAVEVRAPTADLDKRQMVAVARRQGLVPADLFSCYDRGPEPCGHCESCARSARAWA